MLAVIASIFWLMVIIAFIGDTGINLYAIPYYILKCAKELWQTHSLIARVISALLFVIGCGLHVLVRVIWYGLFIAIAGGAAYFVIHVVAAGVSHQ